MSNPEVDLNEVAKASVEQGISVLLASDDIKKRVEDEYKKQVADLMERAEKRARWWSALAGLLVLSVFSALLLLQYADIRTKQADLYEKFSQANELVGKINTALDAIETQVAAKSVKIDKDLQEIDNRMAAAKRSLDEIERRLSSSSPPRR